MKKQLLSIATIPLLLLSASAHAQTWDGSGTVTTTSVAGGSAMPMVGIGTNAPAHELDVVHEFGYPNINVFPAVKITENFWNQSNMQSHIVPQHKIFEVKQRYIYDTYPVPSLPPMWPPIDIPLFNIGFNAEGNLAVGVGKDNPSYMLDVAGDIHADGTVTAPAATIDNLDVTNNLNVTNSITAQSLATGSTQMVVANGSGTLSTQSIPVNTDNQTLSINGNSLSISNGNSVTLPTPSSTGDNLGSHVAGMVLDMDGHDIDDIDQAFIDDAIVFTSSQAILQGFGTNGLKVSNKLAVNGLITGTENFLVSGDGKVTGKFTCSTLVQTSDKRLKENIVSLEDSEDVMTKLKKVVPYQYNFTEKNLSSSSLWKFDDNIHYGFMAQEIQNLFPQFVSPIDEEGHLGLNYIEFIPLLLQAVKEEDQQIQEHQTTIDQLNKKVSTLNSEKENLAALQSKLAAMEEQLNALKGTAELVNTQQKTIGQLQEKVANLESDLNICCQSNNTHTSDTKKGALKSNLDQNVPNPFSGDTKIGFTIVEQYASAFIGIYDLNGRQIMQIPIAHDANHVMFANEGLTPGMYVYSLVVDSQLIDSKKMIISE